MVYEFNFHTFVFRAFFCGIQKWLGDVHSGYIHSAKGQFNAYAADCTAYIKYTAAFLKACKFDAFFGNSVCLSPLLFIKHYGTVVEPEIFVFKPFFFF